MPDRPKRRFRFRFNLRTLFAVMLVVSLGFGWVAYESGRQRRIVSHLQAEGAYVIVTQNDSALPASLDMGYARRVTLVGFTRTPIVDIGIVSEFQNLESLFLDGTQVEQLTPLSRIEEAPTA